MGLQEFKVGGALVTGQHGPGRDTAVVIGSCTASELEQFFGSLPFRTWLGTRVDPLIIELSNLGGLTPAHLEWLPKLTWLPARKVAVLVSRDDGSKFTAAFTALQTAAHSQGLALRFFWAEGENPFTWLSQTKPPPLPSLISARELKYVAIAAVVLFLSIGVHARVTEAMHWAKTDTPEGQDEWGDWAYDLEDSWRYALFTPFAAHDAEVKKRKEAAECEEAIAELIDFKLSDCSKSADPALAARAREASKRLTDRLKAERLATLEAHPAPNADIARMLRAWAEREDFSYDLVIGIALGVTNPTTYFANHEHRWYPSESLSQERAIDGWKGFKLGGPVQGWFMIEAVLTLEDSGEVVDYSLGGNSGSYVPSFPLLRYRFALTAVSGDERLTLPEFVVQPRPPSQARFTVQRDRAASTYEIENDLDSAAQGALVAHVRSLIGG